MWEVDLLDSNIVLKIAILENIGKPFSNKLIIVISNLWDDCVKISTVNLQ